MLREIDRQYSIIHIADREYRVRYSLDALLCLETLYKPIEEITAVKPENWSAEDILQLARAAMCSLPENQIYVRNREFEKVRPSVLELAVKVNLNDLSLMTAEIVQALAIAFPEPEKAVKNSETQYFSGIGHTRAVYCDIMGRSDIDFWTSTHKEIAERINYYLEAKGLKERPVVVRRYDDD